MENKNNTIEKIRFTTLVNPTSLTKIKLISYFTNTTFSEIVDESFEYYILNFESTNKLSINDLISLKDKFSVNNDNIEDNFKESVKINNK